MRQASTIDRMSVGLPAMILAWLLTVIVGVHAPVAWAAPPLRPVAAPASKQPPTWGQHGMVLFGGRDGLFASHLPMFHAPHDWHVVIALEIEAPVVDAAMRQRLAAKPALWTLVPEDFELARLAPRARDPITSFKADIVEGHFERGGKTIYGGVIVRVLRTDRFERLDAAAAAGRIADYEPVGQGSTWFLVKEVRARPDFDHVVMIASDHRPPSIAVPVKGIAQPTDASIVAKLPATAHVVGTVYYDTEDLQ